MTSPAHSAGFTLTELLIAMAIMAIITMSAVPMLTELRERLQARQDIARLQLVIRSGREQALLLKTRVTLCPSDNQQTCLNDWNKPLILFTDTNNSRQRDADERLLQQLPEADPDRVMRLFNNSVISFDARGFAGLSTGSFSYCLKGQQRTGAAFIISRNGNIRAGQDSNQDGLPETANGNNVPCPS